MMSLECTLVLCWRKDYTKRGWNIMQSTCHRKLIEGFKNWIVPRDWSMK